MDSKLMCCGCIILGMIVSYGGFSGYTNALLETQQIWMWNPKLVEMYQANLFLVSLVIGASCGGLYLTACYFIERLVNPNRKFLSIPLILLLFTLGASFGYLTFSGKWAEFWGIEPVCVANPDLPLEMYYLNLGFITFYSGMAPIGFYGMFQMAFGSK